jgi:hypothetical protein
VTATARIANGCGCMNVAITSGRVNGGGAKSAQK